MIGHILNISPVHKDICNCPMRYKGSHDMVCGREFAPDRPYEEWDVYATENRLTGRVTAYISPVGEYSERRVVIPYADVDTFNRIWEPTL